MEGSGFDLDIAMMLVSFTSERHNIVIDVRQLYHTWNAWTITFIMRFGIGKLLDFAG